MTERSGLFLSFEGTEGSGKTTQMRLLAEKLRAQARPVTTNQEPGATHIGGHIREILLTPAHHEMAPETELLLMFASRTQAAAEIIRPALERGEIVLSDRFTDSTLAYQGEARRLGFDFVLALHRLVLGKLLPDLTLFIDIRVEDGLARAHRRNQESGQQDQLARLDRQPLDFHWRVREGYQKIAALEPQRFRVVDGRGDPDQVAGRVWAEVSPALARYEAIRYEAIR
jgi:dTMP kinase